MAFVYVTDIYSIVSVHHYYCWQVLILLLASISFQAIGHLVALITNGHFILMILCLASFVSIFLMFSNAFNPIEQLNYFQRLLSYFSILRFVNQSDFWLIYGGERCLEHEIQSILYQLMIPNTMENFLYGIAMLVILAIFYHCLALWLLIIKSNPMNSRRSRVQRIQCYHKEKLLCKMPSTSSYSASSSSASTSDDFVTIRL